MADNLKVTLVASGPDVATDEIAGVHYERVKLVLGADGFNDGDVESGNPLPSRGFMKTVTATYQRPNDTVTYAIGDAWSTSTSSPAVGTLADVARGSGGSVIITDLVVLSDASPALLLTGEILIFDSSVTPTNDNAVFTASDTDMAKLVGTVAFALNATASSSSPNSYYHARNLAIGATCVGSDDLVFLVKVGVLYVPVALETLTIRAKCIQVN